MVKRQIKPKRAGDGPDRVYQGLRRVIVEQTLAVGARLPEDAVASRFGVSRTVVRAAIGRLVMDGLVERENNRVARVASPTTAESDDLSETRHDIEAIVVRRLVASFPQRSVEKLLAHVQREVDASGDGPAAVRLSGEFHILLAEATGSKLLQRYVTEIVARSSLVFTAQATAHSLACAPNDHAEIIDAIVKGDTSVALARMAKHLEEFSDRSRQLPGPAKDFADLAPNAIKPLT